MTVNYTVPFVIHFGLPVLVREIEMLTLKSTIETFTGAIIWVKVVSGTGYREIHHTDHNTRRDEYCYEIIKHCSQQRQLLGSWTCG